MRVTQIERIFAGDLLSHRELHWAGLDGSSYCESCCLAEFTDANNVALS